MCFSANVSILTFTIGIVSSILCVSLGKPFDKILGYFVGFVSLMQGIDFLLWKHQICDNYNKILSKIGMLLNHLQPIVLGIVILIFNKKINKINKYGVIILMIIYLFVIIPYSIQYFTNSKLQCTLKGNKTNPHLIWQWNYMKFFKIVYTIFLITICLLCLIGLPTITEGFWCSLVACITYVTSLIIYPQKSIGALWCFYVIFIPIIYFILRKTHIIKIT